MLGCRDGSDIGFEAGNSATGPGAELSSVASALTGPLKRYMYAGTGTTLRVYDMDDGHRLVKTINLPHATGQMTGICGNVGLHTLFMNFKTTNGRVIAMDLHTDQELWWKDVTPGVRSRRCLARRDEVVRARRRVQDRTIELVLDGRTGNEITRFTLAEGP